MKLKIIPFFLLMFATYIEIIKTIAIKEQNLLIKNKFTEQNKSQKQNEQQNNNSTPTEEGKTGKTAASKPNNDQSSLTKNETNKDNNSTNSNLNISSILHTKVELSKRPYKITQCDQNILFKGQTIDNYNNYCNKTNVYFEINAYLLNVFNGTSPSQLIRSINMHHLKKNPKLIKGNNQCIKFTSEHKEKISLCVSDEKEASEVMKAYDSLMDCHASSKGKKIKHNKCNDKEREIEEHNNKKLFDEVNKKHNKQNEEKIHYYHYPGDVLIVPGSREQIKLTKHQKEILQKNALATNIK